MARNKYPENTIKKILEEAENLFIANGYANTSMQYIIDALSADMTKGAIYHHFKSKKDIFYRIFEKRFDDMMVLLDEVYNDSEMNGADKINKSIELINSLGMDDPLQAFLNQMHIDEGAVDPDVTAFLIKMAEEKALPYVNRVIEEGIADKSIRECNPEDISEVCVYLLILWLTSRRFVVGNESYARKIRLADEMLRPYGINLNVTANQENYSEQVTV